MTIFRFAPIAAALALPLALALAAPLSFAQYVWTDEKGVKQFSDMPPPANVPQQRILKQPAAAMQREPAATAGARDTATESAASKAPLTTADRNAEFNKRRMAQAEQEKKAAQQAERQAAIEKNCARARDYSRLLQSGQHIASTDRNGERSIMSDEQRAHELGEAQRILGDCK